MFEDDETLNTLRDALELSPENALLRSQYARLLMGRGHLEEAETVLRTGLEQSGQSEVLQIAMAECYRRRGNASAALVIIEELIKHPGCKKSLFVQYARLLLTKGQTEQAARAYRQAIDSDPNLADPELAELLGVAPKGSPWEDKSETDGEGRLLHYADEPSGRESLAEMEKPKIKFKDVGGMDEIKEHIRMKIIAPIQNPEIFRAYGKPIGGSLLLYGPPGCGKTYLARATAGEISAGFFAIGLHHVLDMYIGNSEQRLHTLFENARAHTPCVLFFDEVDALAASRTDMRSSAGRHLINQFLSELDGIESSNEGILILAATNAPWHLDGAFRRPGRFDRMQFVPPPDQPARTAILQVHLGGKPQDDIDYSALAARSANFSGADLKAVVEQAVEQKLKEALTKGGIPQPLRTKDLLQALKAVKPSTAQWFSSARNYALYANDGGMYDEILDYLKMR